MTSYWLMKSEPDEFSIDDLKKMKNKGEPWSGVRNYQARNFINSMKPGDLVYFYHSSCPEPGIAGLMEVQTLPYPDPKALDSTSPYFDPKHTKTHPRWFVVDVVFKDKFEPLIALDTLRNYQELKNLIILRRGNRLSVTPLGKKRV